MEHKLPDRIQHIEIVESKREIIVTLKDVPTLYVARVSMVIDGRRWVQMAYIARELQKEMTIDRQFDVFVKHEEINGKQVHSFNVRVGGDQHVREYAIFARSIKVSSLSIKSTSGWMGTLLKRICVRVLSAMSSK